MTTNQEILAIMQEMFEADPDATDELIETRVDGNNELAGHPTIVVNSEGKVGILGVLNGITWKHGERLEAMYDDETKKLIGFRLMPS